MDESEKSENVPSLAPFDDVSMDSSKEVVTQMPDSLHILEEEEKRGQVPEKTKQILDFDWSHSVSAHEGDRDLEVTTQVLDTLDALDMVDRSENAPNAQNMEIDKEVPISPSKDAATRALPAWMTEPPPAVVTRRSLFLSTQTRHRKKQLFVEEEEVSDSTVPKYLYTDIAHPSEMNLERVICFDVESTGFASTDGIIEIGAVEYIYGQRTGVIFQSYIKPSVPVNHHAAEVHGLTNMMLASAPSAKIVIPSFLSWVGSSPLIAHNARFDMRMLQQEANRLGIGNTLKGKDVYCTMRSYRKLFPGRPYAMIDLYTALLGADRYASNSQICNPKLPNHSAIVDCEILGEIFLKLAEEALQNCLPPP